VSTPLVLRASTESARLEVIAEDRVDIEVGGEIAADDAGVVTVATASRSLVVRVPRGTELVVGTTSGRVRIVGSVGAAKVATESGRVEIEQAERLDVRTRSGRVDVGTCQQRCLVHADSGRVSVDRAGGLDVHTGSGRVAVGAAHGDIHVRTTSGRVSVGIDGPAVVDAETVSGRIDVDVERGLGTHLDQAEVGRRVHIEAPTGDDCLIRTKTVSGRIRVRSR